MSSGHEPERRPLRPVSGRSLALCAVLGLVGGWLFPRLVSRLTGESPMISWAQPLTLVLVAAILGFLAWHTWRTVQQRGSWLEVDHALNRLVLARACALAGALVAGGYAGYAITWLGDASERADQWMTRAVIASLAAVGVMATSLILERACRTPGDPEGP